MQIDAIDRRILAELQADGTLSQVSLAEKVGASAASCWRRIKALEAGGALGPVVRLIQPDAVGLTVNVLCHIRLKNHLPETTRAFEALLDFRPEIVECYAVSGDWDYFLRIVTKDIAAYETFLRTYLLASPAVGGTASNFALSVRKYTTALPI
jgi:Lrp/AsnC family transcriptional regulator